MLVSIILKLILKLILWYLFLFNLWLCFKTKNLFGAQFDKFQNVLVYKIIQKIILARRFSFDRFRFLN